jgi:hypothetical protein
LPQWGIIDQTKLAGLLSNIAIPLTQDDGGGTGSFSTDQTNEIVQALVYLFDPAGASIANLRQQMTTTVKDFCDALARDFSDDSSSVITPPTLPTVQDTYISSSAWITYRAQTIAKYPASTNPYILIYAKSGDSNADSGMYTECYEWWLYRYLLGIYNQTASDNASAAASSNATLASLVTRIGLDQTTAASLHDQIHGIFQSRMDNITALVTDTVNSINLLGESGFIKVDGDRITDTRFYVTTYVDDWGWESAPSVVSDSVDATQYDSVTVTITLPPTGRNIIKWRLYRSNTGTDSAQYQFVQEILVADGVTYKDIVPSENLGEVCPTFNWNEPPYRYDNNSSQDIKPPKGNNPHLRGLVSMPNGVLAGFIDNYVAFCDPYHPYAWPIEYQITTDTPIVGLGVFGQSLFVGTMGRPYIISGADSASMSAIQLPQLLPCVSAQSIVGIESGVVYASNDGLVMISANGAQILTSELYAREDWQAINPASIVAIEYDNVYYFWTSGSACFALDFNAKKLITISMQGVTAVRRDELTDKLFVVSSSDVTCCFSANRRIGLWRTGILTFPDQAALAWAVIFGDQSSTAPVTMRWYGDGSLRYERKVTDITPFRLPPGRPQEHEVEIDSAARITRVQLASSTAELQGI